MMRSNALRVFASFAVLVPLAGCASLDIVATSKSDVERLWSGNSNTKSGYVIHAPMVVVERRLLNSCDGDKCQLVCAFGKPFTLPDLTRPYLINARPGLGKLDVELAIGDGWRLDSMKQSVDNTAILGALQAIAGGGGQAQVAGLKPSPAPQHCSTPQLFRIEVSGTSINLTELRVIGTDAPATPNSK